jgi:hypothetical protein
MCAALGRGGVAARMMRGQPWLNNKATSCRYASHLEGKHDSGREISPEDLLFLKTASKHSLSENADG